MFKEFAVEVRVDVEEEVFVGEDLNDAVQEWVRKLLLVVEVGIDCRVVESHVAEGLHIAHRVQ